MRVEGGGAEARVGGVSEAVATEYVRSSRLSVPLYILERN